MWFGLFGFELLSSFISGLCTDIFRINKAHFRVIKQKSYRILPHKDLIGKTNQRGCKAVIAVLTRLTERCLLPCFIRAELQKAQNGLFSRCNLKMTGIWDSCIESKLYCEYPSTYDRPGHGLFAVSTIPPNLVPNCRKPKSSKGIAE